MKNTKKRKRYFSNKKRNTHWTEEPKGHAIDFADKYIQDGSGTNKFTKGKKPFKKSPAKKKATCQKWLKRVLIAALSICLISVGYTGMDIYITRHAVPVQNLKQGATQQINMSEIELSISPMKVDEKSLDGSVMLSSIIEQAIKENKNSIVFDAKRVDGSIGYQSALAIIDTYGTISNAASSPKDSIEELTKLDLLPVARICCYRDNIIPAQNPNMALKDGKKFYNHENSTYLNPNRDETYNYIRDIIRELNTYGVNVIILSNCDLPGDISKSYNDGFEYLSKKLTRDLGKGIKFIKEVNVTITGIDKSNGKITNSAIKKEIKKFPKLKKNEIYCISTKLDDERVAKLLDESDISSYIIGE